jgi:hypothetical protein
VAAIAALLLIVSTLGPFSLVEAAEILTAAGVLALLKQRADGREFHLPFGDGTVVFAAGVWCGLLIATRIFDRPPGMTVLALVCALLLAAAGLRERAKRAPDDLPESVRAPRHAQPARPAIEVVAAKPAQQAAAPGPELSREPRTTPAARRRAKRAASAPDVTRQLTLDEDVTERAPGDSRSDA